MCVCVAGWGLNPGPCALDTFSTVVLSSQPCFTYLINLWSYLYLTYLGTQLFFPVTSQNMSVSGMKVDATAVISGCAHRNC